MGQLIKGIIYPFIYAAGISLAFLIMSSAENKIERQRIWVIYIVSFFIIFFWAAFEQAGSSLTFIADNKQTEIFWMGYAAFNGSDFQRAFRGAFGFTFQFTLG
jgi:POT family proton-dependent oligopeptide transporter